MSKADFIGNYPQYGYDGTIDELFQREFSTRLDSNSVYLDHAGTTLYGSSQLNEHFHQLQTVSLNNPHSEQEDSMNLLLIHETIEFILSTFETSSRHYSLIFTLNTTHACQYLASIFPFDQESEFAYMLDCHNSVVGIRQRIQNQRGICSIIDHPESIYRSTKQNDSTFRCVSRSKSIEIQSNSTSTSTSTETCCLFAAAAENNFNGLRPPIDKIFKPFIDARQSSIDDFPIPVHRKPSDSTRWFTLVDCAKLLSTESFSLRTCPVDFLVFSFYKIFGYPTGLGALIIRNEALKYLKKDSYFGGGSVEYISPYDPEFVEYKTGIEAFVHGTIPFTNILAVRYGLKLINESLTYRRISSHTKCLIEFCREKMEALSYPNGQKLCIFYGQRDSSVNELGYSYGPILNFNFYNDSGQFISCRLVQRIAADHKIILRVGTFCAPGASQAYLDSRQAFENNKQCRRAIFCGTNIEGEDVLDNGQQPLGSIRISVGWMTRYEDIERWMNFVDHVILKGIGLNRSESFSSITNLNRNQESFIVSLEHIYIYPIKSCAAQPVDRWPLTSYSLLYDREWLIVDQNLNPLTLKRLPILSKIRPRIDLEQRCLILSANSHTDFIINIDQDHQFIDSAIKLADGLSCSIYKGEIENWLSKVLGVYATLARRSNDCEKTLANEGAFLLVYEESVRDVQSKLVTTESITHQRFRPNLVVDKIENYPSPTMYTEDQWKLFNLIDTNRQIQWKSIGPCQRCSVVNVDPDTGKNQSRLFTRLQTERRPTNATRANFGILLNLSLNTAESILCVKDRIEIL